MAATAAIASARGLEAAAAASATQENRSKEEAAAERAREPVQAE